MAAATPKARGRSRPTDANALATIPRHRLATVESPRPELPKGLARFASIPSRHGVAVLVGQVVVYDEEDLQFRDLEEGAFYVVEYQRPRCGMSWEMFHEGDRRRLDTAREVVRVDRSSHAAGCWITRHAGSSFVDGPLPEWHLTDKIVGRVVGIYEPSGAQG